MKLHYKGKYDLNPESLPHGEHKPGAVKFKEVDNSAKLALIANGIALIILIPMFIFAVVRAYGNLANAFTDNLIYVSGIIFVTGIATFPFLFIHELFHALCFKEDVYMYTNWKQGMLFISGTEDMSKGRFVFMSLLPNIILGVIPYIIGMIFPELFFLAAFGALMTSSGAGDYYNVFNAITQMPKGARVYMYCFNSYWYLP